MEHELRPIRYDLLQQPSRMGQCFVVRGLEVEVASQGESPGHALGDLREALELYFEGVGPTELPVTPILAPVTVELPQP